MNRAARVLPLMMNAGLVQGSSVLWSIPVELHYYVVFAALWWLHVRHDWHCATGWSVVESDLASCNGSSVAKRPNESPK